MKRIVLIIASVTLTFACHHPTSDKEVQPKEKVFVLTEDAKVKNPYGILFTAKKFQDIHLKNVGQVAAYQFPVRNVPPDQKFTLSVQQLGGIIRPVADYDGDDDGQLGRQLDGGTMMLDNDLILMFDFWRGEPVDYWLFSKDGQTILKTTFVPYPIQAKSPDGATVSIRRLVPDARLVLCEGDGFLSDEKILISSQSAKKVIPNVPITCANGRFSVVLEVNTTTASGGIAYFEVRRFSDQMILEYPWGCEALDHKKKVAASIKMDPDALVKLSLGS